MNRSTCTTCGGTFANNGFAMTSHDRSRQHETALRAELETVTNPMLREIMERSLNEIRGHRENAERARAARRQS